MEAMLSNCKSSATSKVCLLKELQVSWHVRNLTKAARWLRLCSANDIKCMCGTQSAAIMQIRRVHDAGAAH